MGDEGRVDDGVDKPDGDSTSSDSPPGESGWVPPSLWYPSGAREPKKRDSPEGPALAPNVEWPPSSSSSMGVIGGGGVRGEGAERYVPLKGELILLLRGRRDRCDRELGDSS